MLPIFLSRLFRELHEKLVLAIRSNPSLHPSISSTLSSCCRVCPLSTWIVYLSRIGRSSRTHDCMDSCHIVGLVHLPRDLLAWYWVKLWESTASPPWEKNIYIVIVHNFDWFRNAEIKVIKGFEESSMMSSHAPNGAEARIQRDRGEMTSWWYPFWEAESSPVLICSVIDY